MNDYGNGMTPLHYASYQGNIEIVQELISRGAKVNSTNNHGFTPLFYAAQRERVEVCSLLLDAGADPTLAGQQEDTVLCPVDCATDCPAILQLFAALPSCNAPAQIDDGAISGAVGAGKTKSSAYSVTVGFYAATGILRVIVPPQGAMSKLPVKSWHIQLFEDINETRAVYDAYWFARPSLSKRSSPADLLYEVKLEPQLRQTVTAAASAAQLLFRLAAVNSIGEGEKSGLGIVDIVQT